MNWWNKKVVCPVKRAWIAIAIGRAKPPEEHDDEGISKLQDEVQTCQYQDVQVMWEMLNRSKTTTEMPPHRSKPHKRHGWRLSFSSRRTTSCDSM